MPFKDFEITILRKTATDVLKEDFPVNVPDEQLLALYAYATGQETVGSTSVTVNTIALLNVIEWLIKNPDAYDVLQKIKEKYGHNGIGYESYFVNALSE